MIWKYRDVQVICKLEDTVFFKASGYFLKKLKLMQKEKLILKQVRLKKDSSEGKDENKIAEIARFDCCLFIEDCLQVNCRMFRGYLQFNCCQGSISRLISVILCYLHGLQKKNAQPTDRRTDRQTDRPTHGRTDGRTVGQALILRCIEVSDNE